MLTESMLRLLQKKDLDLPEDETEVSQVAQFEFIPWILTQCATVAEAREAGSNETDRHSIQ